MPIFSDKMVFSRILRSSSINLRRLTAYLHAHCVPIFSDQAQSHGGLLIGTVLRREGGALMFDIEIDGVNPLLRGDGGRIGSEVRVDPCECVC